MPESDEQPLAGVSRRQVMRGAAVTAGALVAGSALAACGGGQSVATPGAIGHNATIPASKVKVGGGYIDQKAEVVVTQPSAGEYRAFSAVCTHQGCLVNQILDRRILCPCHGSQYSITDGAVLQGPAPQPLPHRTVVKAGNDLKVTGGTPYPS